MKVHVPAGSPWFPQICLRTELERRMMAQEPRDMRPKIRLSQLSHGAG